MSKMRNLICTSLATFFAFVTLSNLQICCPLVIYQPELPKK
ncbi:cyclic lactone autoinducer peptide [Syntrophomonas wolfei]